MRSVSFGVWVGVGSRDETGQLVRRLALPGAPAVQGHPAAHRAGHLRRDRGGGRRDQRVHHQGVHLLLRAGARRRPAAGDRRDVRPGRRLGAGPADVETERGVILEEIAMHDDEPGDEVHDLFAEAIYGDHPLGRLISGTVETITPMTRRQIHGFYRRRYTAPSIVVAAAGNLDHAEVVPRRPGGVRRRPAGHRAGAAGLAPSGRPRRYAPGKANTVVEPKDTEQAHLVLGCPAHRPRRRAALRARRPQQHPRRRHVQPAVPGDPGEARPGLLGLLVHRAVRRQRACSASTPAARRARSTRCWR